MIQLNSLQLPQGEEFYTLTFQRLTFALLHAPSLSYLAAFSRNNQLQMGKTQVRLQVQWLRTYSSFFRHINYVLLTQYQEVLLLPYLLRACPNLTVFATSLMYQLARIHLLTFQQKLKDFDATAADLTFDQQEDIKAVYEEKFGLDLTNNPTIFSLKEAEEALGKVVKVNYFQVYDTERGVQLIAHPSGKNNGACLWQLQGEVTEERILLINDISQHQWRTCQPYNLPRLQPSQPHHIIFTRKALSSLNNTNDQQKTTEMLSKIGSNMTNSLSTVLILSDQTSAVDLVPRIAFQPEGRCQAAFFSDGSLHDFTNFCNSYVDYLSEPFRNIIFSQSPDYPLIHYSKLKEKGLIQITGLEETAIRKKLPVREVVMQNAPFVLFIKNYEHLLQTEDLSSLREHVKQEEIRINIENNFTKNHLEKFIAAFPKAKVYGFGVETGLARVNELPFNIMQMIGGQTHPVSIMAANLTSSRLHAYTLTNNELQLRPTIKELTMLPRAFIELLFSELTRRGVTVIHRDSTTLQTSKTMVTLSEDYTLKVTSSHTEELLAIQRILSTMIQTQPF